MTFLLSLALKGAIVLALGALAAFAARNAPASVRHGVWAATFAVLLAVPVLEAAGPAWTVGVLPSPEPTRALEAVSAPAVVSLPADLEAETVNSPVLEAEVPVLSPSPSRTSDAVQVSQLSTLDRVVEAARDVPVAGWLGGLWALGVVIVASVWLRAFVLARRLVLEADAIEDERWTAHATRAARQSGLEVPRVLRSDALTVPIAWGFGRLAVVLPPSADGWDDERIEAVLLHEMAHLRRHDAWTQVVAQAALALHWPNPLAWIAYRRFMDAREQACDDAVLRVGGKATSYASHLVALARELSPSRLTLAAVSPMAGRGELETRVRSILDGERKRDPVGRRTLAVTLVLAIAIGGPLAAFHPVSASVLEDETTQVAPADLEDAAPDLAVTETALQQAARDAIRTLRAQSPDTLDRDADWDTLEERVTADVSRALAAMPDLNTAIDVSQIIEDAMADAAPSIQQSLDDAAPRIEQAVERALLDVQPVIDLEVERATRAAMRQVSRSDGHQAVEIHDEVHDQDDVRAAQVEFERAHERVMQAHRAKDSAHRRLDVARRAFESASRPAERRSAQAVLEDAQEDNDKREHDLEDATRERRIAQRVYERAVEAATESNRRNRAQAQNERRNEAKNQERNEARNEARNQARSQARNQANDRVSRHSRELTVTSRRAAIRHLYIPDDPGTLSQRWDSALQVNAIQLDWPVWVVWGVDNREVRGLHSNVGAQSDLEAESFQDAVSSVIPGRLPDVLFMVKVTQRGAVQAVRLRSPNVAASLEDETVIWLGRNSDAESRALLDRLYAQTRNAELRSEIAAAYSLHTNSSAVTAAVSRMIRSDPSPVVRSEALQWLSRYHCGDECVTLLIEAVEDDNPTVRREALDALIEADTATSKAAVRRFATSHSDPGIRREAAEAQ